MPLITVAIPFSQESTRLFELAIRSVFAQSTSDWRLLLTGDDPRPELLELARRISDDRVQLTSERTRRGLAARLNESVRLTDTPFYARMDADDVMFPDRLDTQLGDLASNPSLDVIGSRAVVIDELDTAQGLLRESSEISRDPDHYLISNAFTHPTVSGRTGWFREHPYQTSFGRAEDKDLWMRTFASSGFWKDPSPRLFYRVGSAFDRKKSVRTAVDDVRVSLRGRRYGARRGAVLRAAAIGCVKAATYRALPPTLWPRVRDKRICPVASTDLHRYQTAMDELARTRVPGWDV